MSWGNCLWWKYYVERYKDWFGWYYYSVCCGDGLLWYVVVFGGGKIRKDLFVIVLVCF